MKRSLRLAALLAASLVLIGSVYYLMRSKNIKQGIITQEDSQEDYIDILTIMVESQVEDDASKRGVMDIYNRLGGSETSRQRADEICDLLQEGQNFEEVIQQHGLKVSKDIGLSQGRAYNDQEMLEIQYGIILYTSEVAAAQTSLCPDTKVEVDLN